MDILAIIYVSLPVTRAQREVIEYTTRANSCWEGESVAKVLPFMAKSLKSGH